jgi:tetratricopeptide (TPR) repeat protein
MSGSQDEGAVRRQAVKIEPWARWIAGIFGVVGLGSGGAAVYLTHVEAGPVALIAGGALFLLMALSGVLPTRLKIGDNEAEWQEVAESVSNIRRQVPELGALLDSGGFSLGAIAAGQIPAPSPNLVQAGVRVGALTEDVRFLQERAGQEAVPPDALLEIGRGYLAQQDWSTGARFIDEYVRSGNGDWETYFALGVAYANSRQGEKTDRAALRAYDEAISRLPANAPVAMTARLYSHRAGMKKRLGRLVEARIDAEIALRLATKRYEKVDAIYNLACVEAMLGNRDAALRRVAELNQLRATDLIFGHLDDYFRSLRDDPEFQRLIGIDHDPAAGRLAESLLDQAGSAGEAPARPEDT